MTTTRLVHPSLIAGHAALAMLALATVHFVLPTPQLPQWHAAGQSRQVIGQAPRRLPASRRGDRALGGALSD